MSTPFGIGLEDVFVDVSEPFAHWNRLLSIVLLEDDLIFISLPTQTVYGKMGIYKRKHRHEIFSYFVCVCV